MSFWVCICTRPTLYAEDGGMSMQRSVIIPLGGICARDRASGMEDIVGVTNHCPHPCPFGETTASFLQGSFCFHATRINSRAG